MRAESYLVRLRPYNAAMELRVFSQPPFPGYELCDSGEAEKLERFGELLLRRPDPQALWSRRRPESAWRQADLTFVRESDRGGRWEASGAARRFAGGESAWTIGYADATFVLRATPFKHVGLFPEQASNWDWVAGLRDAFEGDGDEAPRLLNLFGYTGAASVLAAQAGYRVTHVDASKTAIAWTRENVLASGLPPDALRTLADDALAFAKREVRRERTYDVVLLDPPHYGRGPKGETWQFEDDVAELVGVVRELCAKRAAVCLSTYAIGTSPTALSNLVHELGNGSVEVGELVLPDTSASGAELARPLPAGFCARWTRGLP